MDPENGEGMFALSTAGVVSPPLAPGEENSAPSPDGGGGIQLFSCGGNFFEKDEHLDEEGPLAVFMEAHLICERKDSNEVMDDLKFSPDARFLAAGSHDNYIYVYELGGEVPRLHSICKGHSSYITHIDWSADDTLLMSNSGDYELNRVAVLGVEQGAHTLRPEWGKCPGR